MPLSQIKELANARLNFKIEEIKVKELSGSTEELPQKNKPYCGCGQYYSCTSALYLHIRSKHSGVAPVGTIGGPKGIVKKPIPQAPEPTVKLQELQPQRRSNQIVTVVTPSTEILPPRSYFQRAKQLKHEDFSKKDQSGSLTCDLCGRVYSCNSSLNLHLKRKHQIYPNWAPDKRVLGQDRLVLECPHCQHSCASKSALGFHINTKHAKQQNSGYDDENLQKCGCGLVYGSRSALNMHVKKKHGGIYPKGTTQKPNLKFKPKLNEREVPTKNKEDKQFDRYLKNKGSDDEDLPSIYDSESEEERNKSRNRQKDMKMQKRLNQNESKKVRTSGEDLPRPFKCGCGRLYSCSSSLNQHIKRNHNKRVPPGTIRGPRKEEQSSEQKIQQIPKGCCQCKKILKSSYFLCMKCQSHHLCSVCFWSRNNFTNQHEWVVRDDSLKPKKTTK